MPPRPAVSLSGRSAREQARHARNGRYSSRSSRRHAIIVPALAAWGETRGVRSVQNQNAVPYLLPPHSVELRFGFCLNFGNCTVGQIKYTEYTVSFAILHLSCKMKSPFRPRSQDRRYQVQYPGTGTIYS